MSDRSWMDDGLCRQVDGDVWFPVKGGDHGHLAAAKRICMSCPVRAQCLQYALDNEERFGLWGGVTERARRRMKRGQVAA